jgi:hypothetical protein
MPLTDTACCNAKCPEDRDRIRLTDAGGFYLEVTRPSLRNPAGSKLWRYKFRHVGKEKLLAPEVYPKVSLADARKEHQKARALVAAGDDPSEVRKDAKLAKLSAHETSFEPVARQWWSDWKRGKTARYADNVMCRLEADAFPVIGHKPVADLAASYFVRMSKKIEARGAEELARRVLQTCGQGDALGGGARAGGAQPGERREAGGLPQAARGEDPPRSRAHRTQRRRHCWASDDVSSTASGAPCGPDHTSETSRAPSAVTDAAWREQNLVSRLPPARSGPIWPSSSPKGRPKRCTRPKLAAGTIRAKRNNKNLGFMRVSGRLYPCTR